MLISGWYEGHYGATRIAIAGATDVESLANVLYNSYGEDCVGVDMELEGEYVDGTDVNTTMKMLFDELDFLSDKKYLLAER